MNSNLALGFILYNPTDNTIDRILKHSIDGYKIFIYDNDEINNNQKFTHPNINYYSNFRNEGLSVGLNHLCTIAKKNGYSTLLYFDLSQQERTDLVRQDVVVLYSRLR
jgi:hypothetical protein